MHLAPPSNVRPPAPIVLTVDLEDYFQVSGFEDVVPREHWTSFESRIESNTQRLLEILAATHARATFFVLGWAAERNGALVRRIHESGHEIACHSYEHRLVYQCTPANFRDDTRKAKQILEDLIGQPVLGYRAPSFSITRKSLWALDILIEERFEYDSSIFPILRDRYGIPGAPRFPFAAMCGAAREIVEVPPSTVRLWGATLPVGGGGYLRLMPESLFRWAVRRIVCTEGRPAVLYLHPWEIDPEQPRIRNGSSLSTFRQYVNLHTTAGKLRRLLSTAPAVSVRELLSGRTGQPMQTFSIDAITSSQ